MRAVATCTRRVTIRRGACSRSGRARRGKRCHELRGEQSPRGGRAARRALDRARAERRTRVLRRRFVRRAGAHGRRWWASLHRIVRRRLFVRCLPWRGERSRADDRRAPNGRIRERRELRAARSLRTAALLVEQGEVEQVLGPACRALVSPELASSRSSLSVRFGPVAAVLVDRGAQTRDAVGVGAGAGAARIAALARVGLSQRGLRP